MLAIDRLPGDWPQWFRELPTRRFAPSRDELQPRALMELAPEYMIRLYDDFRIHVIDR